ncbi:MAG: DUF6880 family protein [Janthinobacterium lividum]
MKGRNVADPDAIRLKARVKRQLDRLAKHVPDPDDEEVREEDLCLPSWPVWIDALVDDLTLLRSLDPWAALRELKRLCETIGGLDGMGLDVDNLFEKQDALKALSPSFQLALADGDPDDLAARVLLLVTTDEFLDFDLPLSVALLRRLDRARRESLAVQLSRTTRDPGEPGPYLDGRAGEVLLAEPDIGDTFEALDRLGLRDRMPPELVLQRMLEEAERHAELLGWVRRFLAGYLNYPGEEDSGRRLDRELAAACASRGHPELAQEIRRAGFYGLLDIDDARAWLERLPPAKRKAGKAEILRHVAADERRTHALLFLAAWPDLEAAARLVREHHEAMDEASCLSFSQVARRLEPIDPVAALLLFRRGAFCEFGSVVTMFDERADIRRCEALWIRHPADSIESHAAFVERLRVEDARVGGKRPEIWPREPTA